MMLLGGMSRPVVDAVTTMEAFSGGSSFRRFMAGTMKLPIDDTAAAAEPETEPKSMHVRTVTEDNPPRRRPTSTSARSISRLAMPP